MKLPWSPEPHIPLEQLPNHSSASLRRLSDEDLYRYVAGWRPGVPQHVAAMAEIRRREGKVAWWAIYVSVASLVVAIIAIFTN